MNVTERVRQEVAVAQAAAQAHADIRGWMSMPESIWLGEQAQRRACIVEVGCWYGRTTQMFLSCSDGIVFCVDTWLGVVGDRRDGTGNIVAREGDDSVYAAFCGRFASAIRAGRLVPLRMNSRNCRDALVALLHGQQPDMIWIDADHFALSADLDVFESLLHPEGLLCGHDYHARYPEVQSVVRARVPDFRQGPGAIWYRPQQEGAPCPT